MSGGHFAGILTPLTCRGSKGRSPLASLGTAQRLAPVHSGLPLCETCPVICRHSKDFLNDSSCSIFQNKKRLMMVVLWCGKRLWRKSGLLPFAEYSSFLEQAFHTPLRCEVPDNPMPYPAHHLFLTFFSTFSVTLLLIHFLFLLQNIKIAAITFF